LNFSIEDIFVPIDEINDNDYLNDSTRIKTYIEKRLYPGYG